MGRCAQRNIYGLPALPLILYHNSCMSNQAIEGSLKENATNTCHCVEDPWACSPQLLLHATTGLTLKCAQTDRAHWCIASGEHTYTYCLCLHGMCVCVNISASVVVCMKGYICIKGCVYMCASVSKVCVCMCVSVSKVCLYMYASVSKLSLCVCVCI